MKHTPTVSMITLGCKVNQYESEAIEKSLNTSGWISVHSDAQPDVCIINTCAVTHKAVQQARQTIRHVIRSCPSTRVIVTGCYAQTETEEIRKINGIHMIVGHGDKHLIPKMIRPLAFDDARPLPHVVCRNIRTEKHFQCIPVTVTGSRTRPFLKIQDGCDAFCTYCIVPHARGPSRSMPVQDVLDRVHALKESGYHEVVLSGIHTGNYGVDLRPKTSLLYLLKKLDESAPLERLRLSSIEPREITQEIIDLSARSPVLCPHFHIPLQSGDNRILERMHRPYSREYFKDLVLKIHGCIPDVTIGVDVMVGFPGETRDMFQNTCRLIRELPIAYLHVFRFSARKGTPAAAFPDPVPSHEIKARSQAVIKIGYDIKIKYYKMFLNKSVQVLVEHMHPQKPGLLQGRTRHYVPVFFKGDAKRINTLVMCRIENIGSDGFLMGTMIRHAGSKRLTGPLTEVHTAERTSLRHMSERRTP